METSKLQWFLTNINDENFEEITEEILDTEFIRKRIKELVFEIYYVSRIRPKSHSTLIKFIQLLYKRKSRYNDLKTLIDEVYRFAAEPTMYRPEQDQIMCVKFLRKCYNSGLFDIDKIKNSIMNITPYLLSQISCLLLFFSNELISSDKSFFYEKTKYIAENFTVNAKITELFKNPEQTDWNVVNEYIEYGWLKDTLEYTIIMDDLEAFYNHKDFSFDYQTHVNFFDHNDYTRNGCSLQAFAGFYAARKIFRFLVLNQGLSEGNIKSCVAGGCIEILEIFDNYDIRIIDELQTAADFRQYEVFKHFAAKHRILNKKDRDILIDILEKCAFTNNLGVIAFCHKTGVPRSVEEKMLFECAQSDEYIESFKLLIKIGLDYNKQIVDGWTPAHNAAANGSVKILEFLITCIDFNINCRDKLERTPLHLAAAGDHLEAVALILRVKGVDINVVDQWDRTPLHHAAANGQSLTVDYLVKCPEIRINQQDRFGKRAYDLAEHPEVQEILKKYL